MCIIFISTESQCVKFVWFISTKFHTCTSSTYFYLSSSYGSLVIVMKPKANKANVALILQVCVTSTFILFICSLFNDFKLTIITIYKRLFNDALSSSDYIVLNDSMSNKQ
jgi:hypothetical protein